MVSAAIIATQLTTPETRVLSVFIGGRDVTRDVKWDRFTVTDSGTNAKGTANIRLELTPSAATEIYDQALVEVVDHTATGGQVFRGFVVSRRPSEEPGHSYLDIIAHDIGGLLDDCFIPFESRPAETMQARIGYLWGKYAGAYLSGDLSNVASIGGTLEAQDFAGVTLRQAIEAVIAQASSTADYSVDMLGKPHVFTSETNPAPFDIDADAPTGGERAPQSLDIDYDANSYANRVYVQGATPEASGFFQDGAAIAAANGLVRTAVVQAPDCETLAMATSLGLMYLGRVKAAKARGVFTISSPNDGWRAGQYVLITSAAHGLTAQSYRIARVTTKVLKPGSDLLRSFSVEFGGARAGGGRSTSEFLGSGQLVSGNLGGQSNTYITSEGVTVTDGT